jgi:carboxypeptidase family protein
MKSVPIGGKASVRGSKVRGIGHAVMVALAVFCSLVLSKAVSAQENRRLPGQRVSLTGSVAGTIRDQDGRPIAGVAVQLHARQTQGTPYSASSGGDGIYRLSNLPAGDYDVKAERDGFMGASAELSIRPAELQVLDFHLQAVAAAPEMSPGPVGIPGAARTAPLPPDDSGSYPIFRAPEPENPPIVATSEVIPSEKDNFAIEPYRWTVEMPEWQRYGKGGEFPYVTSHWYDPFNRNRLKGDKPIFGQRWFFDFTGTSLTQVDVRRLPTPSNVSAEEPGSQNFFGRGEQAFVDQSFRLSFDLFRGDTSFRPVDFRVRFTPVVDLNFLQTRERGIVNVDPRAGTNRFDTHTGIQEAFVEAKIHDVSPNFDFVSIRLGIQAFSSDFRGFIFVDEQPGIRLFGNLRSNRVNYNLAYFYLLEKDTNSGLNMFEPRHQQVGVGNIYIQDFFAKGYTTEFSFHYNYDQGGIAYDKNGFLVRPAPIGGVVTSDPQPHSVRAYYLGWTGNGHIRRLNLSNAFYQALGTDSRNSIAGRPVHINAQMGALELSVDKDWLRYRASVFWASGDGNSRVGLTRSGTAHGFDSILDDTQFAGGPFSFWDREGIRLTGTGVALVTPESLLASLRSSKEEGQSNFVNPGVRVYNAGIDADLTPKLRGFVNFNYLQFDRTQTLSNLLFQSNVHRSIGADSGIGISYRPPLTENIVLTAGVSSLVPGLGLRNIYNSRVLVSGFARLRFQF